MLTAVIIDDENDAITVLSQFLKDYVSTPVKVVGIANSLDDGIKLINKTKPEVVFLDIDMPKKSGLEIYNYYEKPWFKVVFVTAYNQYAINAIKKSATDYLLKPINFLELRETIQKITAQLEEEQHQWEIMDKVNLVCAAEMEGKNILLDVEIGFVIENTKNIEYCYADRAYSVIVTYLGKKIVVSKSLKDLNELLPPDQFLRTHKSYLVNIFYIRKYVKASETYVLLKSGTKIPVSIRTGITIVKTLKQMLKT